LGRGGNGRRKNFGGGRHRNLAAPRGGAPLRERLDNDTSIGIIADVGAIEDAVIGAIEDAVVEDIGGGDIGSGEDVGDGGVGSGGCAGPGEEYADARVACSEGSWGSRFRVSTLTSVNRGSSFAVSRSTLDVCLGGQRWVYGLRFTLHD